MTGLNEGYLLTLECYACKEMEELYFDFNERNVDRQEYFEELMMMERAKEEWSTN